jgi:hypothetical protein
MPTLRVTPHPPFDADRPLRLTLVAAQALSANATARLNAAAQLFAKFARAGAFAEVKSGATAAVSVAGNAYVVDVNDLPADPAALGVIGRMAIAAADWADVLVQGSAPSSPMRALEPLPSSLSLVPRLRDPLSIPCEMSPGLSWYCVELAKAAGWSSQDLATLQDRVDLWMAVCRLGGLSEVSPTFDIVPGNVGMDPPQVGADFWAGQIGATDVNLGALSSLVNMFDQASATHVHLDGIEVT